MTKNRMSILLAALVVIALLAACSGYGSTSNAGNGGSYAAGGSNSAGENAAGSNNAGSAGDDMSASGADAYGAASAEMMTPAVKVSDQAVKDGTVTIAEVDSDGPGWLVVHAQADGKPGPILGYSQVADGVNQNVTVAIDTANATETLYAMLHTDAGTLGTFEFPGGDDVPVSVDGKVVTPPFNVSGLMAAGTMVMLSENADLGSFLVDANGMTLYLFLNDTPGVSNCSGGCLANWPALLTDGAPVAGDGVDAALLGTTTRDDGTVQVTYNGWPLYYYKPDAAPGDTRGQGVGNVWYVLDPDGMMVNP